MKVNQEDLKKKKKISRRKIYLGLTGIEILIWKNLIAEENKNKKLMSNLVRNSRQKETNLINSLIK